MIQQVKLGEELFCPVCGTLFKATEYTKYIMKGEYTCSWECFYNEARSRDEEKKNNKTK